jgi:hypothetical protein
MLTPARSATVEMNNECTATVEQPAQKNVLPFCHLCPLCNECAETEKITSATGNWFRFSSRRTVRYQRRTVFKERRMSVAKVLSEPPICSRFSLLPGFFHGYRKR